MLDVFKVKDAQLVNNLFVISDTNASGALDIRELIGNIIFWVRGALGLKFALFFEVFSTATGTACVARENLGKVLGDALKVFKESFFQAKTIADKINSNLNGMISFDEFKDYCKLNPQTIDFMCRLTIGPYPISEDL
jgi:Ca2+-binding EF-hand superfamily protein